MASVSNLAGSIIDPDFLSDVESEIHFTTTRDLKRTLYKFFQHVKKNNNYDHTVLIVGFPPENFTIDDDYDKESLLPKTRKALYFAESKILILTMPDRLHEEASRLFNRQVELKLNEMNCREEIIPCGGATARMKGVSKEPDECWRPINGDLTCIFEAAVLESDRVLHRYAKIWLEHPEQKVTQVVTMMIGRARPEIILRVWKQGQEERDTRAEHPPRATLHQTVRVTLAEGDIRLSFQLLFKRKPRSGTAEKDTIIFASEIEFIARVVWQDMGFM
ncbi:hypothetical protein B7463_g2588, partial [Scytalidium lignicola]